MDWGIGRGKGLTAQHAEFANRIAGRLEYCAAQLEGYDRQAGHQEPRIRAAALRWAAELVLGEGALVTREEPSCRNNPEERLEFESADSG